MSHRGDRVEQNSTRRLVQVVGFLVIAAAIITGVFVIWPELWGEFQAVLLL